MNEVRCSNVCRKLEKGIKNQGVNNFNFHVHPSFPGFPSSIILTGAETQSEGEAEHNFSEETTLCGKGRD